MTRCRPSKPFIQPFFEACCTSAIRFFMAGILAKNFVLSFLPSFFCCSSGAVGSATEPSFMSPAPYQCVATVPLPHSLLLLPVSSDYIFVRSGRNLFRERCSLRFSASRCTFKFPCLAQCCPHGSFIELRLIFNVHSCTKSLLFKEGVDESLGLVSCFQSCGVLIFCVYVAVEDYVGVCSVVVACHVVGKTP